MYLEIKCPRSYTLHDASSVDDVICLQWMFGRPRGPDPLSHRAYCKLVPNGLVSPRESMQHPVCECGRDTICA